MLKGIPPILNPEILQILRAMGHGDEIALVDANFPAESAGPPVIRLDGVPMNDLLDAVLSLLPLDTFVDQQAFCMEVVGDPAAREETHRDFDALVAKHEPGMGIALIERFAFYDRVEGAFAVIQTGERRLYGNILLKKGIIRPA